MCRVSLEFVFTNCLKTGFPNSCPCLFIILLQHFRRLICRLVSARSHDTESLCGHLKLSDIDEVSGGWSGVTRSLDDVIVRNPMTTIMGGGCLDDVTMKLCAFYTNAWSQCAIKRSRIKSTRTRYLFIPSKVFETSIIFKVRFILTR